MSIKLPGGEEKFPTIIETIYYQAVNGSGWVEYQKVWYTPMEFVLKLGRTTVNHNRIRISKPETVISQGREVIKSWILQDKPKEEIISALHKLHEFTDRYYKLRE